MAVEGSLLIRDIAIVMVTAVSFGFMASKLGQPPIIGYLLAGLAIGPASRLVLNPGEISILSNLGVTLLMFMVGLEFSTKRIRHIWKASLPVALMGIALMFGLGVGLGMLLGLSLAASIFLGVALGMSSTIVSIKSLGETGQMDTLFGKMIVAILVVEDIVAIALITVLDNYGRTGVFDPNVLAVPLVGGLSFMFLMFYVGRHFLSRMFNEIGRTRSREIFLLAVLGVCLGVAALSISFQMSMVLGAFVAGLMLSESQSHHRISQQIESFKDVFLVIFFVSVGMSVDLGFTADGGGILQVLSSVGLLLVLVGVIIIGKVIINAVSVRAFGYPAKTSLLVGLGLLNIGEFSFVIMKIGFDYSVIPDYLYSALVLSALITMAMTPHLIRHSGEIYLAAGRSRSLQRIEGLFPRSTVQEMDDNPGVDISGHVVVLGAGGVAEHLIEFLKLEKREFVVVDNDMMMVEHLRDMDISTIYGDACNPEVMEKANLKGAKIIVVSLASPFDIEQAVVRAREMNPKAYIVARINSEEDEPVIKNYADEVVLAHLVAGKMVARHALSALGYRSKDIEKRMSETERAVISEFEMTRSSRAF